MAYAGGVNWVVIQKAIYDWVVACTGLAAGHVIWGSQQAPRPEQPAIIMRLTPIADGGAPWVDHEANYLEFDDIVVTSVDATADTFTKAAHGLSTGDGPANLVGLDLPANLAEDTNYWVIRVDANTFKLADSFINAMTGVALDLGDTGSGTITLVDTETTTRAGEELMFKARSNQRLILNLECYTSVGVGVDMATSILWRIEGRRMLPTKRAILDDANIAISSMGPIRAIPGMQDLVLFEPRALVDIIIQVASEDEEVGGAIHTTNISSDVVPVDFTVDVDD